jgi:NADP-dependent 3-hydroxy acid dehydrogenase YdfG
MRVLITGAGRAIGAATARVFHEQGCEVIATARDVSLLADVPATLRLPLDVTSEVSVAECMRQCGEVDVLVNNAAIAESGPLETYPIDRFRAAFETNTVGALRMVQAVAPGMRQRRRGCIVNVSSVNGKVSAPLEGTYAATK